MKKLRNIVGLIAVFSMAAFMTGCGDDNDDNNDTTTGGTTGGNPPPQFAPANAAGFVAQTYTVTTTNGTATLTFPTANTYVYTPNGGAAENGTLANLQLSGEDWVGTITPADNNGTLKAGEIRLHFTGKDANSYSGTFTGVGADNGQVDGTFTATNAGGGTDGTTDSGTDGGTGAHPADLNGKKVQLNTTGLGGELITTTGPTTFSSELGATGTYTYTLSGDTAHLVLNYDSPAAFANDFYDLNLVFNSATNPDNAGSFSGNQHYEDADHTSAGEFTISNQ
jgi:hypothetical protein